MLMVLNAFTAAMERERWGDAWEARRDRGGGGVEEGRRGVVYL